MPSSGLLQRMVGQLPQLSAADRKRLRQALDFLGAKGDAPDGASSVKDWLLPGIGRELNRRGLSFPLTPQNINRLAPRYSEDAKLVCESLGKRLHRPGVEIRQAHLLAFGRLVARAIAEDLPPGVPVSPKTVLRNVGNAVSAVEASFPDYLSSGMLHRLIGLKLVGKQEGGDVSVGGEANKDRITRRPYRST